MRFVKKQLHWKSIVVIYGAFCTNKKAPPGLGGATLFFFPSTKPRILCHGRNIILNDELSRIGYVFIKERKWFL